MEPYFKDKWNLGTEGKATDIIEIYGMKMVYYLIRSWNNFNVNLERMNAWNKIWLV